MLLGLCSLLWWTRQGKHSLFQSLCLPGGSDMSTLQSCLWSVLGPTMGHVPTNGQSVNSQQKKRREKKSTASRPRKYRDRIGVTC